MILALESQSELDCLKKITLNTWLVGSTLRKMNHSKFLYQ